jgi:hypothetical protein
MSDTGLPAKTHEILSSPREYYKNKEETLEEMLNEVNIDEDAIINTASQKLIRDKAMGFFKITDLINTFINWNETVDGDIRRAKKEHLLHEVIIGLQQRGNDIDALKRFISDPMGNTLYNKITRILESVPPDEQLSMHLAKAIGHIINTDFVGLFEAHKYAISQIEQLTPQALTILSDNTSWPIFRLEGFSATGGRITSDWLPEFTNTYCQIKGVSDSMIIERIRHSIGLLKTHEYMIAQLHGDKTARCAITRVGALILPYISN